MSQNINLNNTRFKNDDTDDQYPTKYWGSLKNHIRINDQIEIHFDNLENHIVRHIEESHSVLGCVAWLTNKKILNALQKVETSIIIQKEDFLRPDSYKSDNFTKELRRMYSKMKPIQRFNYADWSFDKDLTIIDDQKGLVSNCNINTLLTQLGGCCDEIEGIRCAGNLNTDKLPAFPRMHHKFMIFLKDNKPNCVWTGSFNMTQNGSNSLENAVVLTNDDAVMSYVNEWACILTISEKLDWETEWSRGDLRFGT